ncbi:MAG: hypothetical protein GY727_06730, partial [Gammaproteobacteria bacterium]|nr:hypothetical protein [Gammaproteobacteria bacterium]
VLLIMMFVLSNYLASTQGLSVEPKTNIKVLESTTLKVSGGDLTLKSDATGDATILTYGNVAHGTGGKAIVVRYLPGDAKAWHMIGTPVNAMAITSSDWAPDTDEDLYLWHEPDPGTRVNYKNTVSPTFATTNPGDNFVTGQGYIVNYNTANPTNNFESSGLNTGNINITLAKSVTKSWDWSAGHNLISNPYASGLDWNAVTKTGIVTEVWAQIYDPNKSGGGGYEPVNGTIASGQGFFVKAVSDQAVIALQPSQQVQTTTQTFMKQDEDKLVLRLTGGEYFDETKILISESSAPEHDFYDASKYFSFEPLVPQFYTLSSDGHQLAINSVGAITESTVIPLSIKLQGSGIMWVKLTDTKGIFDEAEIILQDVLTNIEHKLSNEPTCNFMANANNNPDRFMLKFSPVGLDDLPGSTELNARMHYTLLYVLNPDAPTATVELYNILGQIILREVIGRGLQSISLNVATGTYHGGDADGEECGGEEDIYPMKIGVATRTVKVRLTDCFAALAIANASNKLVWQKPRATTVFARSEATRQPASTITKFLSTFFNNKTNS